MKTKQQQAKTARLIQIFARDLEKCYLYTGDQTAPEQVEKKIKTLVKQIAKNSAALAEM